MSYFITPSLTITDAPADMNHKGGARRAYRWIVLHATGGVDSTAWLSTTSPASNPVSVHRLIKKSGQIMKIVADDEVAWHAGPARVGRLPGDGFTINNDSLGIEIENMNDGHDPFPDAQVNAVVAQVLEWWGMYGAMAVVGHTWIQANKYDPAGWNWPQFYSRLFKRLKEVL